MAAAALTVLYLHPAAAFGGASSRGVPKWDHTRCGFYRGVRWLLLLRELFYVLPVWSAVRRVRREVERVDVVHANDITVLTAGAFAARKLVVHVRSL